MVKFQMSRQLQFKDHQIQQIFNKPKSLKPNYECHKLYIHRLQNFDSAYLKSSLVTTVFSSCFPRSSFIEVANSPPVLTRLFPLVPSIVIILNNGHARGSDCEVSRAKVISSRMRLWHFNRSASWLMYSSTSSAFVNGPPTVFSLARILFLRCSIRNASLSFLVRPICRSSCCQLPFSISPSLLSAFVGFN